MKFLKKPFSRSSVNKVAGVAEGTGAEIVPEKETHLPRNAANFTSEQSEIADKASNTTRVRRRGLPWWACLGAGMCFSIGAGGYSIYHGWQELEALVPNNVDEVLIYSRPGTLEIQSADGSLIEEIGPVSHGNAKIWAIPSTVQNAFIASEDRRYYQHFGVDLQGVARAAYVNLQRGGVVEGGSSITQQVARIVFLNQETTIIRKLKEMRLATKLEERFSKEQILESYLNLVYLGSGAYGIVDAAWIYFGKQLEELTIAESAMIAGLAPAPSLYSPFVNPELAQERRDVVLGRMLEQELVSQKEYDEAIATPLEANRQTPKRLQRKYPYFAEYIKAELYRHLTPEQIENGSFVVETTLNPRWQEQAEAIVEDSVNRYGRSQRFDQAAMVSIDPRNGQIRTMVGGQNFNNNQYNRVTQAKRQPGSTFKTFVYTAAIASGMTPGTAYEDKEVSIRGYRPKNASGTFTNQAHSLTAALTQSINSIAIYVMLDVGYEPVIDMARRMGIKSDMKPTYSLALGSWEVNLLELTSAYGTLANGGLHQPPYGVSRILDRQGKVIYQANHKPTQAVDPSSAATMTAMLTNVVNSGTGRAASIGRPVAGKTGTTDKSRDLWFVGYIPQLATGVWLGNDDNRPTSSASTTAARIWGNAMGKIARSIDVEGFPPASTNTSTRVVTPRPVNGASRNVNTVASSGARNSNDARPRQTASTATNASTGTAPSRPAPSTAAPNAAAPRNTAASPVPVSTPAPAFDFDNPSDTVPPLAPLPSQNQAPAQTAAPVSTSPVVEQGESAP